MPENAYHVGENESEDEVVRTPVENMVFVREHWDSVHHCDGSYRAYPRGTVLIQMVHGEWLDFASWAAAAEFTEQRLKDVRQVELEIALLRGLLFLLSAENGDLTAPIWERVLAREQAALADLKKGMCP